MERLMGSEFIEWLYNRGKDLVVMLWTVTLGIVSPLKATIGLLILFFIVNCIFGYKAGFKCGEKFNMKKLKDGFWLLITFFLLIVLINQSMLTYNEFDYAIFLVKVITWFFCYHYLVNIVRNSITMWPSIEALKTLYKVLTVDVKFFIENKIREKLGLSKKIKEDEGKEIRK